MKITLLFCSMYENYFLNNQKIKLEKLTDLQTSHITSSSYSIPRPFSVFNASWKRLEHYKDNLKLCKIILKKDNIFSKLEEKSQRIAIKITIPGFQNLPILTQMFLLKLGVNLN